MHIRPIRSTDEDRYRSILDRTSDEDRYCRFFHVVDHFDPEMIRRFVTPEPSIVGLIAEKHGHALGAAHACELTRDCAEVAIVVARDARRQGVALALLRRLVVESQSHGYRWLVAYSMWENVAFAGLARRVGMTSGLPSGGVVRWTLRIDAKGPSDGLSYENSPNSGNSSGAGSRQSGAS